MHSEYPFITLFILNREVGTIIVMNLTFISSKHRRRRKIKRNAIVVTCFDLFKCHLWVSWSTYHDCSDQHYISKNYSKKYIYRHIKSIEQFISYSSLSNLNIAPSFLHGELNDLDLELEPFNRRSTQVFIVLIHDLKSRLVLIMDMNTKLDYRESWGEST